MDGDPHRLDQAILDAHDKCDSYTLAQLYYDASRMKQLDDDEAACAFLLTQAYVFALESNHPISEDAHAELVRLGRDSP